ncbi:TPA: CDP-2,3-bis-(O-geranylgeranyl)-sn-glycerol synthase [Candidatus Bathyarchaeota archaeon]|nr:CDP-2,3-bis-(O-geranylgeranyl)-sn-glycerol synthase [Candidatus Bathyarchaeota archaeon]
MLSLNTILIEVFNALYYIFPAYCANGAPVIFGGGKPIDMGKTFWDGKPLFGSHKTIRGFVLGLAIGTLVGWAQEALAPNVGLPRGNALLGFILSLGAMIGDLLGSFLKRRLDLKPGAPLPISDQMDFVLVALLFGALIEPPTLTAALIILILTGPIHLLVNIAAYLLRLKKTPW